MHKDACLGHVATVQVCESSNVSPVDILPSDISSASDASTPNVSPTPDVSSEVPLAVDSPSDVVKQAIARISSDLTPDQRNRVVEVLTANADLYSTGPFDMGRTPLIEHVIDTGNHKPIKQALRRHPLAHPS